MSLRSRLTAAFLAVVLGPVLVAALFVAFIVDTVQSDRLQDRLDSADDAAIAAIGASCQRLTSAADSLALLFGAGEETLGRAAERAVRLEAVSAIEVRSDDESPLLSVGAPRPSTSRAAWCGPEESRVALVVDTLAARVPVYAEDGRMQGSVVASVPIDAAFIGRLAGVAGADVTVDDARSEPLTSYGDADSGLAGLAASARADGENTDGEHTVIVRRVDPDEAAGLRLVLSVHPVVDGTLYLFLAAGVAAAAGLALVAAAWMARSTTKPLTELVVGAESVARGELSVRVPVRGNDELTTLARTFNRMAAETQGYVSALTSSRDQLRSQLTLLGETLSSTLDLGRMLEMIVDTAMAATGARAGIVLLADPHDPTLIVGHVGQGMTERGVDVNRLSVRLGEGLLGQVASRGVAAHGRVDTCEVEPAPGEPRGDTFIAVPVMAVGADSEVGRPLGVLAVYDRAGGDAFDDADVSTLGTFAGQAAVAVGNVLSHREAQRLSLTDPLTGLWNYRYLQVSLSREIERAGRFHRSAAVIAIDLDKFKAVNDTYGHPAGDVVLAEVARRINSEIRDVDLAFRYGGEEFVVLLPEADADGAARVAVRLRHAVRDEPVELPAVEEGQSPQRIRVTVSLGVAAYPEHGGDGTVVLAAADEALYSAKAAGRDTWRVAGRSPIGRLGSLHAPD
ncbi:diguanylate cyclase [Stackebrandtia soli]|uniref:diguanylate cyclase n=1 Tax=Stackebrandtia soli TaxID=1892856 RepID=UPI0039E7EFF3